MKISEAVSKFSDKFERFKQAYPNSESPKIDDKNSLLQQRLSEKDFAFKKLVISTYKKYRFPYKTLGETSSQADEIAKDEKSLISAYNLFSALSEANKKNDDPQTFIKAEIVSPLTKKEIYTLGDAFIYLQCYLQFEQKLSAFIPYFVCNEDKSFSLKFQDKEKFQFKSSEKEILSIIKSTFYAQG